MPSAKRLILKDSHPAIQACLSEDRELKGRRYDIECSKRPGGIRASEVLFGLQMACMSITDNEPGTLANVGKLNPWQIQSLKIMTGGTMDRVHLPLEQLLKEDFDLTLDHLLDISGITKAGHILDTQGFIAHNDTTIVLSFRCTTSASDWITNLTTTSSAWELEKDIAQGHSGMFSALDGMFGFGKSGDLPRVHTGFYNNFLVSVPFLREHIDPLLSSEDQPPRTLYVVGHSLGGGIAAMAGAYYLTEFDWENLPHKLRIVTAGGPRSYLKSMRNVVDRHLEKLRESDKAIFARVVRDKDEVARVPPYQLGFAHPLHTLVFVPKDNETQSIVINPNLKSVLSKKKLKLLMEENDDLLPTTTGNDDDESDDDDDDSDSDDDERTNNKKRDAKKVKEIMEEKQDDEMWNEDTNDPESKYQKTIGLVPQCFRDHMPEFYLNPLYKLVEKEKLLQEEEG